MKQKLSLIFAGFFTILMLSGCGQTQEKIEKFVQMDAPQTGDTIAIIKTNFGELKLKLLPEIAPKTVENFVGLAKKGYYNGITFHRVIDNFMIQGGDPSATGAGGESLWGEPFADEFSPKALHFRGALSMANSGPNSNGSQFFIIQNPKLSQLDISKTSLAEKAKDIYTQQGGTPHLDGKHTVFGQLYQGFDVLDKIATTSTDPGDKPLAPVTMESVTIETVS